MTSSAETARSFAPISWISYCRSNGWILVLDERQLDLPDLLLHWPQCRGLSEELPIQKLSNFPLQKLRNYRSFPSG